MMNQIIQSAGIFVQRADGMILGFKRVKQVSGNNVYGFVGGKADPGETLEEAAIRETFEEAAIVVKVDSSDYFEAMVDNKNSFRVYRATIVDGIDNIGNAVRENEGCAMWIKPEEMLLSPFRVYNENALQHFIKND